MAATSRRIRFLPRRLKFGTQRLRAFRDDFAARNVITSHDQVTPDWLTRVLRRNKYLVHARVVSLEFIETATLLTSEFAYFRARFSQETGLPERFFLKHLRQGYGAQWAAHQYREERFYREPAVPPQLRRIPLFDVQHSADHTRGHFLFQDMTTTHYRWWDMDPARQEHARMEMIDELAQFHAAWWQHPLLRKSFAAPPDAAQLAAEHAQTQRQLAQFAERMGDALTGEQYACFERLLELEVWHNLWAWTRPAALVTLEHGQPHPTNFLFTREPEPAAAMLLDWQTYRVGLGAYDLAYLLIWFLDLASSLDTQRELLARYFEQLRRAGITHYASAQLELDFRWGILYMWWLVLKLGSEAQNWDNVLARASTTWRAMELWGCQDLIAENRTRI